MNNKEKFLNIVKTKDGRVSSTRCKESYFRTIGEYDLWVWFIETTWFLDKDTLPSNRILFLEMNELPTCNNCGIPHQRIIRERKVISEYCSERCRKDSTNFSVLMKERSSKVNKDVANSKRRKTMKEKYGVEYNTQRESVKTAISERMSKRQLSDTALEKLSNSDWLRNEYLDKMRSSVEIGNELGVDYSTVLRYARLHNFPVRYTTNSSIVEKEIGAYLESLGCVPTYNDRTTISPLELDILVDRFAIEVNGLYWHSFSGEMKENKNKHKTKYETCVSNGIKLFQLTDYEWYNKKEIIKSQLAIKLGLVHTRIYARKCSVVFVDKEKERDFLSKNHIQGYIPSKICVGLEHNGNLVMVISIGHSRFNKQYDLEILRMCSVINTVVVGGFSKLLSKIRQDYSGSIISYVDLEKGDGESYKNVGFERIGQTDPGYFWTDGNIIIPRSRTMKRVIDRVVPGCNKNHSESEIMFSAGYRRFWNTGNAIFSLD